MTVIRDRDFFESHQTRTIISLVDGAAGFRYGTYSPTELSHVSGAAVDPPEQHAGGTMHTLRFPRKLKRGEPWTFSFREHVPEGASDGAVEADVHFSGQSFESPTLEYLVDICFLGDTPSTIWTYDKLSRIERPGVPTSLSKVRPANAALISTRFTELYGGLCSGLAWRWASIER